jgi:mono/diheme cytochrome c family protein
VARLTVVVITLVAMVAAGAVAAVVYVRVTGLSARPEPGALEARLARAVRGAAVPRAFSGRPNPVPASRETLDRAMAHFAEHCAVCHGPDGRGATDIGRGLFPRPPDMRASATQALTDGELFYIIEHGIRFTGMPAFATGDADGETSTWELVHFIRRLPGLGTADLARMEQMTPRSPEVIRREIEDELFLQGADVPAPPGGAAHEGAHP